MQRLSVESQLQSKRLGWLGQAFRIIDHQVRGHRPPRCSRSSSNDAAVRDLKLQLINRPCKDGLDKTCFAGTFKSKLLIMGDRALLLAVHQAMFSNYM